MNGRGIFVTAFLVGAIFVSRPLAISGQSAPAAPPAPCVTTQAKLLGTIDTKVVKAGEPFRFVTVADTVDGSRSIPAGTQGAGTVMTMDYSKSHGESGYLVLEARYLELADGTKIPAALVPGSDGNSDAFMRAGDSDAPYLLGYIPYVGIGAGVYDYFHHGKDAAFIAGTIFPIIVGNGFVDGSCTIVVRSSPAPDASR